MPTGRSSSGRRQGNVPSCSLAAFPPHCTAPHLAPSNAAPPHGQRHSDLSSPDASFWVISWTRCWQLLKGFLAALPYPCGCCNSGAGVKCWQRDAESPSPAGCLLPEPCVVPVPSVCAAQLRLMGVEHPHPWGPAEQHRALIWWPRDVSMEVTLGLINHRKLWVSQFIAGSWT